MSNDSQSPEHWTQLEAEKMEALGPIISRHPLATNGAKTADGGELVSASTNQCIQVDGTVYNVARVGDVVRYADGTESVIVSGAGDIVDGGKSLAIVGSHIANGDTIVSSPQGIAEIIGYTNLVVKGFLEPGYMPPSNQIAMG